MNIVRDLNIYQKIRENLGLICLLCIAGLLRFLFLNMKSPHFDEGVYGFFVQEIWRRGFFPYDPSNFHGPTYYYALQVAEQIFGRGLFAFRFMSGVFSMLAVYYTWRLNKFFGEVAIWAALALAVSPAFVFYSRYAMHESLFVLLQILFTHQYFNFVSSPNKKSACFLGVISAFMFATKETTIIFLFCFLLSDGLLELNDKMRGADSLPSQIKRFLNSFFSKINLKYLSWAFAAGALMIVILFSELGSEPTRISDFFKAYSFWTQTGTGHASGHEKRFDYWLSLLVRYEWPALVGLLFSPFLVFLGSRPAQFFTIFAVSNLLAYAAIPYKTPWCILGIIWPLFFLMGFAMKEMHSYRFVQAIALRGGTMTTKLHSRSIKLSALLSIALCLTSFGMAVRLNFFYFQDSSEPYVYVQSSIDVNSISEILSARVERFPEDRNMSIVVGLKTTWPFPWVLAGYPHLSYRENLASPNAIEFADVIIIDQADEAALDKQLKHKYLRSKFKLRDSYSLCTIFLNPEKFHLQDVAFANNKNFGGELSSMKFALFSPEEQTP